MTGSRSTAERPRFGVDRLPEPVHHDLRRAVRLEWITLAYLSSCVVLVAVVMGQSQAMQAAWAEDLLGLVPPIAFLVAARVVRRRASARHPYGFHRAVAVGHLVAAVALAAVGAYLVVDAAITLITREHPAIGSVELAGRTVWLGWIMIAVLAYCVVGPVILGRLKLPLAERLHDKVLHADADMNKADWMTAGGAILGVIGIGLGLWWADAVAAGGIGISVLRDGWRNLRHAVAALADSRARTVDDTAPHPLTGSLVDTLTGLDWVSDAAVRVRDQGHVFHVEAFVVPTGASVGVDRLDGARRALLDLDWKVHDVVVVPVAAIPAEQVPPEPGDPTRSSGPS